MSATTSTSTAPAFPTTEDRPDPGLGATIRAEWAKLRSARGPRRNLLLGTVLGVGLSLALAAVTGATYDEWPTADQASFDPILYPLSGSLLMAIFFVAASVGVVASEYSSGMIRLTFTVTPKRGRVLLAKAIVVGAAVGLASIVAVAGMLLGSQAVYAASDVPSVSVLDGTFLRTLLLLVVTGPVFPVIAVAVAFLLRTATASVITVLALILAPNMFGGLLPDWWQRNVMSLLPGTAADAVSISHLDESPMHLHPVAATLVVLAWLVIMLTLAHRAMLRRDA